MRNAGIRAGLWRSSFDLLDDRSTVELGLEHGREGVAECPEYGKICVLHDHARERRWRHLNFPGERINVMKMGKGSLWISSVVTIAAGVLFAVTSRAGYETASYEVVKKEGNFEIRKYKSHVVVTTPMTGEAQNQSFGRLFKYISGSNEAEQKIKMTTPVFMPASGEGQPGEMQFVLPSDVAEAGAPSPSDPSVKVSKMSGGKFAVLKYNGRSGPDERRKKLAELRAILAAQGLSSIGNPVYAGYDPPWTPGPVRRNEVLLRLP